MHPWTEADIGDLRGTRVVITGGNSGIGAAAAQALAAHGAAVVITARDPARGAAALTAIRTAVPDAQIELGRLDLADLGSVRRFADTLPDTPVDLLVNNAGVMSLPDRRLTRDGFEMQFGTNHLGHFALTGLLLGRLLAAPHARVVSIASIAHRRGRMAFDDLQAAQGYRPWRAYSQSKLANLLFALELQRRLARAGAAAISVAAHPGVAATNLALAGPANGASRLYAWATALTFAAIGQSPQAGAWPTLFAATSPTVAGGAYIGPSGIGEMRGAPVPARMAPQAQDEAGAARLWQLSEQLTGMRYLSGTAIAA